MTDIDISAVCVDRDWFLKQVEKKYPKSFEALCSLTSEDVNDAFGDDGENDLEFSADDFVDFLKRKKGAEDIDKMIEDGNLANPDNDDFGEFEKNSEYWLLGLAGIGRIEGKIMFRAIVDALNPKDSTKHSKIGKAMRTISVGVAKEKEAKVAKGDKKVDKGKKKKKKKKRNRIASEEADAEGHVLASKEEEEEEMPLVLVPDVISISDDKNSTQAFSSKSKKTSKSSEVTRLIAEFGGIKIAESPTGLEVIDLEAGEADEEMSTRMKSSQTKRSKVDENIFRSIADEESSKVADTSDVMDDVDLAGIDSKVDAPPSADRNSPERIRRLTEIEPEKADGGNSMTSDTMNVLDDADLASVDKIADAPLNADRNSPERIRRLTEIKPEKADGGNSMTSDTLDLLDDADLVGIDSRADAPLNADRDSPKRIDRQDAIRRAKADVGKRADGNSFDLLDDADISSSNADAKLDADRDSPDIHKRLAKVDQERPDAETTKLDDVIDTLGGDTELASTPDLSVAADRTSPKRLSLLVGLEPSNADMSGSRHVFSIRRLSEDQGEMKVASIPLRSSKDEHLNWTVDDKVSELVADRGYRFDEDLPFMYADDVKIEVGEAKVPRCASAAERVVLRFEEVFAQTGDKEVARVPRRKQRRGRRGLGSVRNATAARNSWCFACLGRR